MSIITAVQPSEQGALDLLFIPIVKELLSYVRGWALRTCPYKTPIKLKVQCDLFIGDWVPDPSGSVYTNASCHVIESHQNCMKNGRPDSGYLYWRWNPRDCELPRFDPERFLDYMRDKSWAFIGDSISRNHVQSLLCILSQVL
ncbi:hypothetical protein SLEP1_g2287 [Rubroshorea leprosula]|uniref:Trichome birefringence-like N-terminal domain-containing protein n=1 Tax=Rubroshorea leprosula TaxID=152421 RepID=A0AAV5HH49_9ROSI|nr:hypothetical protein SLEP1_g2287 [Rubroshorea leprosula]